MSGPIDQGFRAYNAKLETTRAPYDPVSGLGDKNDPTSYVARPGVDFFRPWIAIRNGMAFQWPLGLQGYSLTIDPTLGIHKFIGDNKVTVDVLHAGEEHFVMSGEFPGNSAPYLIAALRDVVYRDGGEEGKILCIPEIMSHAQRVQVIHFEADRDAADRGRDATYSIELVRIGIVGPVVNTTVASPEAQPAATTKGKSTQSIHVDAKHNTLRKIAAWKLGDANNWRQVYNDNENFFVKNNIPLSQAPSHKLNVGVLIYF